MPRFSGLFTALLAVTACSSAVTSEQNSAIPIPPGATVQFHGRPADTSPQVYTTVSNDSVHHMIQRAIVAQLRQKGYTVVDSTQSATFAARYFLAVQSTAAHAATGGGVSGPAVGGYRGYGYGYGQEGAADLLAATPDTIKQVSFEVSLVDEKAGRTAWRGIYQREPKRQAPDQSRIDKVVAEVFTTLPKAP